MDKNKAIIVLLVVILILGIILGIKVYKGNNSDNIVSYSEPENNISDLANKNQYTNLVQNESTQQIDELNSEIISLFNSNTLLCVLIFLVVILLIVSMYKVYIDLGINKIIIYLNVISFVLCFISLFLFKNIVLCNIFSIALGILSIILSALFYKAVGLPSLIVLTVFIPVIGQMIIGIASMYAMWNLGNLYNKGTGFKIGLILLPFIFVPILAFTK